MPKVLVTYSKEVIKRSRLVMLFFMQMEIKGMILNWILSLAIKDIIGAIGETWLGVVESMI